MYSRSSKNDTSLCRVLDGKLGLAVLSCNTTDSTAQSILTESLADVLDVEGLNVEGVQAEESDGVVDVETHGESRDEIGAHLEGIVALGEFAGSELNSLLLDVHANLKLAVLNEWGVAIVKHVSILERT